jgi:hypothetical protein
MVGKTPASLRWSRARFFIAWSICGRIVQTTESAVTSTTLRFKASASG